MTSRPALPTQENFSETVGTRGSVNTKEDPLVSPKRDRTPGWNRGHVCHQVTGARTPWVPSGGMLMVSSANRCRLGERRALRSKRVWGPG